MFYDHILKPGLQNLYVVNGAMDIKPSVKMFRSSLGVVPDIDVRVRLKPAA